jgi:hypothetical protein
MSYLRDPEPGCVTIILGLFAVLVVFAAIEAVAKFTVWTNAALEVLK